MSVKYTTIVESKLSETKFVKCECCGFKEEYTTEYIENIRNLYIGKMICGLCSEAVKNETKQRKIRVNEALEIHMKICSEFGSSRSPSIGLISEIGEMFKRRLILNLSSMVTRTRTRTRTSIMNVDGGEICATVMIGGAGSCMSALTGGV